MLSHRLLIALPVLSAGVLAIAAPIVAQQMQKPGAREATRVTGGTYKVDDGHTMVGWRVDHMGITPYFGMFGGVTGSLVLDPKSPNTSKVDITIPVGKITTANAALTAKLLSAPEKQGGKPDFFGPNPADARFVSTAVVDNGTLGDGKAKVTGNLTLNGVTRPITLDVSFYGAAQLPKDFGGGEQVGFEATGTLKRSEFGLGMGVPLVSDEVQLDIVAAFVK